MSAVVVVRLFTTVEAAQPVLERARTAVTALGGLVDEGAVEPYPPEPGLSEASFRWVVDAGKPGDALGRVLAALGGRGWIVMPEDDDAPSATWSAGEAPLDPRVRFANVEGMWG